MKLGRDLGLAAQVLFLLLAHPATNTDIKLRWTWPSFNANPDSCVDDSTKPLLDLYRGELFMTQIPEGRRFSLGFLPATGYADRSDSCLVETPDTVRYAVFELVAEDGYGNKAPCGGNQELVAIPARDPNPGLVGIYYNNEDLTGQYAKRTDPQVSFTWGTGAPVPGMGVDTFSEHWEGQINFPVAGVWSLSAIVEDGWRAWVGGVFVSNDFGVQNVHESSCQFVIEAPGWTSFVVEAMHHNGNAQMTLSWTPPGGTKAIVPASNLRN